MLVRIEPAPSKALSSNGRTPKTRAALFIQRIFTKHEFGPEWVVYQIPFLEKRHLRYFVRAFYP